MTTPVDTNLDLVLKREISATVDLVWRGLTDPEWVKQWFCPKPWGLSDCRIDLRPGGEFYTVMVDPDGNKYPGTSCILEVETEKKFSWTTTMHGNYRPAPPFETGDKECAEMPMTAIVTLEQKGDVTHYMAHLMHNTEAFRIKHEEMGFNEGWGTALTQLEELLCKERK